MATSQYSNMTPLSFLQQQGRGGIYDPTNVAADSARTGINVSTGLTDPQYNQWFGQQLGEQTSTHDEQLQEQLQTAEAQLAAQAEQTRFNQFNQILDKINGNLGTPGNGVSTGVTYDNSGIQSAEDAANQAAYARAKDTAGQTGRAAMTALQNNLAARGLGGSRIGNAAAAGVVNTGATQLGDVNREQLIQTLNANRQRASEQLSADVTQRGQDVTMRGQNIQAATAPLTALLGSRAY